MTKIISKIYLDYAATTPLDPKVLKAMLPYFKKDFGNPSSIHQFGQKCREAIDKSREIVADFLNCSPAEIIFTGSATEANNLAILGTVQAASKKGLIPHIITSKIEHPAVLEPFRQLEKKGVMVSYLKPNKDGVIQPEEIKKALKSNTILVSIMYANNEIGTIQPIPQIAKIIHQARNSRSKKQNQRYPLFHTDAVQALNYLNCDVQKLGVDLLTLSGHKIYGPKGVGALYLKQGTPISPLIFGGGQENGLRSGTENTPLIIGLAAAISEIRNSQPVISKIIKLRDKLINEIIKKIPDSQLNGSKSARLPNNVNVSIKGIEGEAAVMALDLEGFAVSTGSACSSKKLEPSHVLMALGMPEKQAHSSLRISLGKYTTEQEIDKLMATLPKIVENLRRIANYRPSKN